MEMGETLKKMRCIYGFTVRELSTKLGISPSYLSEIENNKKEVTNELLIKYSNIFQIKLAVLLLLDEKKCGGGENRKSDIFIRKLIRDVINRLYKLK